MAALHVPEDHQEMGLAVSRYVDDTAGAHNVSQSL